MKFLDFFKKKKEVMTTREMGEMLFIFANKNTVKMFNEFCDDGEYGGIIERELLESDNFFFELSAINMFCETKAFSVKAEKINLSKDVISDVIIQTIDKWISAISERISINQMSLKKLFFKRFSEYEESLKKFIHNEEDPVLIFDKIIFNLTGKEKNDLAINMYITTNFVGKIKYFPDIDWDIIRK